MRTSARVVGLDDLILLELGGCPDCEANLRPDPRIVFPGAAEKDEVESYLHAQVSSGAMPWAEAQREIAANGMQYTRRFTSDGKGKNGRKG